MDRIKNAWRTPLLCLLLSAATMATYWPVLHNDFIRFDDRGYITDNPHIKGGLKWENILWAFRSGDNSNWHPLTWISHMLDLQLFGLNPTWHHLINLLFHIANSVMLLLLLRWLTGALWRSSLVAALFALHPLHVESVAWAAERKDVLSTFFFMLTLLAYAAHVKSKVEVQSLKPKVGKADSAPRSMLHIPLWYTVSLFLFALGLMSKPMLVTLPFVLLLLDYWPLHRVEVSFINYRISALRPLLLEKLPFFALSTASCVVTFLVQRGGGAMMELSKEPLGHRLQNALVAYTLYLKKMLWPVDLAIYYPLPTTFSPKTLLLAATVLIGVTALALAWGRRRPWLPVGWFWYLGMMIPVIGVVQVGAQAMADRYTYLPLVGVFVVVVWGSHELVQKASGTIWVACWGTAVLGCVILARAQVQLWRDSETLFRHAITVTQDNALAHLNLGNTFIEQGKLTEGAEECAAALQINPRYAEARVSYGCALQLAGRYEEAITQFRLALALQPQALTHQLIGTTLLAQTNRSAAVTEFRAALQLDPTLTESLNDLAWALATAPEPATRNGSEAVAAAEHACRLTQFRQAQFLGTLAAAYAEAGRFQEAVQTAEKAKALASASGQQNLAARNEELLKLYRQGKAYHEAK